MNRIVRFIAVGFAVIVMTTPVFAHCDAVNGPVVSDARVAIETGSVEPVLKWVVPEDEETIRNAFDRTMAVRDDSDEARALADHWFYETLVRIHRAAEGAPYTGLRPASYDPGVALRMGDKSLENGSVETLEEMIIEEVRHGLRERFAHASETRKLRSQDVESGRDYVASYVEFMHYVDRLHRNATTNAVSHEASNGQASHDH